MLDSLQLAHPDSLRVQRMSADAPSLALALFLNSEPYRSDPRNHAVHTELVEHGTDVFLVTKKLHPWQRVHSDLLCLSTLSDALELVRQLLEGLTFFHANSVARVPTAPDNIRMDIGLAPTDVPLDRAEFPVRYYFMDLADAGCFERVRGEWKDILRTDADADEDELAEVAEEDEDQEECVSSTDGEYDPYAEDIYDLGVMLQTTFKSVRCDPVSLAPLNLSANHRPFPPAFPSPLALISTYFYCDLNLNLTSLSLNPFELLTWNLQLPGNPLCTLTASMTHPEPSHRPSAESALEQFEILWDSLDPAHLDAPVSL
ncbi:hypothetical protein BOTBODRAFT_348162 [Botryobasidium botryosum FD-172 SS1]|uniref:Protein kinase domain-containing protein n=1 Tax=Botryobasidium botryosum (strain FD-172 SS1) TaxID=930990 RepID=A0A067MEU6_BOTB1|nr:hypothetical protein BOTBODRAFT_348162 [Botryobasidium botryosum FD-172 SS1]